MNNQELCNNIKKYVQDEIKMDFFNDLTWDNSNKLTVVEEINSHFNLEQCRNGLFYNRDESLRILKEYLDKNGTKNDIAWIKNKISGDNFSDIICNTFPEFVQIYSEANTAYKENLTEICGGGFRKALERLVFDYAIWKGYDEEQVSYKHKGDGSRECYQDGTPKEKSLSDRINEYLSDVDDISDLANAARKLGNNFTHIIEINDDDYTLENLIEFINALADDISNIIAPSVDEKEKIRRKADKIANN